MMTLRGMIRRLARSQPAKWLFPQRRSFANPEKDKLFESVRYTVDTRGLDYMHTIKDAKQWALVQADFSRPLVVCFYATYC